MRAWLRRQVFNMGNPMMKKLLAVLLVCGFTVMVQGRLVRISSYQQMFEQSDLIAIAQPISTKDTAEQSVLPNISPEISVVGVETEFVVQIKLKGSIKATEKFVLHHYRDANHAEYSRGPTLVAFNPVNKESFLLFLKKETDGRFAPINGQTDPGLCGISPSDLIDLIVIARPVSKKVQTEETIEPNMVPMVHLAGYQTEFEVQELLKGEKEMKKFVLHHYERINIPSLAINFEPQRDRSYLLFLKKEADGRFAPITRRGEHGTETISYGFSVIRLPDGY